MVYTLNFLLVTIAIVVVQTKANDIPLKKQHHLAKSLAELLDDQIHEELTASANYLALATHFGKETINRPGFAKFFKHQANEKFEDAQKLIDYLNLRGATVHARHIATRHPNKVTWENVLEGLRHALELEGKMTDKFYQIHANSSNDGHLTNFLESEFLDDQVDVMRRLAGYVNNLDDMTDASDAKKARNNLAEYLFDLQLQSKDEL